MESKEQKRKAETESKKSKIVAKSSMTEIKGFGQIEPPTPNITQSSKLGRS
jgi:hypothetical protein